MQCTRLHAGKNNLIVLQLSWSGSGIPKAWVFQRATAFTQLRMFLCCDGTLQLRINGFRLKWAVGLLKRLTLVSSVIEVHR